MPKFKFSDIALNSTEKRAPIAEDMNTYIGLEHLDSDSLHVTRWGSAVPIKGDKLCMRKGDVLFGKRNAYLRRTAIAPHDGLFSAHGMILRPNENTINAQLFPFFLSSRIFYDEAIRISIGSLSPTINWRDLAELEFNLPPIEEQEQLAEQLWAFDATKEAYKRLLSMTDELVKSQFIEMFGDPSTNPKGWPIVGIGAFAEVMTGGTPSRGESDYYGGNIPWIKTGEIEKGLIFDAEEYITERALEETNCKLLPVDTIMLAMYGQGKTRGQTGVLKIPAATNQACAAILPNSSYNTTYLYQYLRIQYEPLRSLGRGAQQSNLNLSIVRDFPVLNVPLKQQESFAAFVDKAVKSKSAIQQCLEKLELVRNALMEKVFG